MSTQVAAGERAYWEFEVTEDNAIAILDYAAMLEYPTSHAIKIEGAVVEIR